MSDVVISKSFPAVEYVPVAPEVGTYFEDREINGVMYRLQNATYDGTQWTAKTSAASFATTFNADGSISHYMVPAGVSSWTTWQYLGNGQQRVFNVRDFGAVGDGNADDTTAIQDAAAAAAASAIGGYIYLPAGKYLISSYIPLGSMTAQNVPITIGGDGAEFTTLKANYHINSRNYIVMVGNAQFGNAQDSIVQTNIFVEKIRFDANASNNPIPPGNNKFLGPIYLKQVQNCGVRDCEIVNSSHHGIVISGDENSNNWPTNATRINFQILRNHVNLNTDPKNPNMSQGFPIRAEGANYGLIQGNVIGDVNLTSYPTNDAIDFPGSSHVVCCDNYVTNCGDGMGSNACTDSIFANNRIVSVGGYGISTFSSGGPESGAIGVSLLTITGNVIIRPSQIAIRVSTPSSPGSSVSKNFAVTNNTIELLPTATQSAILVEASQGSVTGNLLDLGASGSNGIVIDSTPAFQSGNGGNAGITVSGNTILNGGATSIGIFFKTDTSVTSTSSNCTVTDNNVQEVSIPFGAAVPYNNVPGCVVRSNPGINPWGAQHIVVPQISQTPQPNPYPFDIWITVTGGSQVTISINGNPTGISNGSVLLPAGNNNVIKLGYSNPPDPPPSWSWLAY